jgi:hypothetical protein
MAKAKVNNFYEHRDCPGKRGVSDFVMWASQANKETRSRCPRCEQWVMPYLTAPAGVYTWGEEGHGYERELLTSVSGFCTDELDNSRLSTVYGPDGQIYNLKIQAFLVPVGGPAAKLKTERR